MKRRSPPLNSLRVFEAAARLRSFRLAAAEQHVSAAAISQSIRSLEESLGVELFRRGVRSVDLTATGQQLLPPIQEAFASIRRGLDGIARSDGPRVTVSAPPALAAKWLMPRIGEFLALHRGVDVQVVASTDILPLRGIAAGSVEGEVDMAIRFGRGSYLECNVHRLSAAALVPICSPSLTRRQPIESMADLDRHTLIHNDGGFPGEFRPSWSYWFGQLGVERMNVSQGLHFNNTLMTIEAALEGAGVALGFPLLVEAEIAAGRLVVPLPHIVETSYAYWLVSPEQGVRSSAASSLLDWLRAQAARKATQARQQLRMTPVQNVR